jgi:glycine/D-amino acid oxidase-like deaminating enzyme
MRIAILGAGFAGLGTALFLLLHSKGNVSIDLFDPQPIGGGVSGLSAGLLHPFTGRKAERVKKSGELLASTHTLLTEAAKGAGKPIVLSKGIVRPAFTPQNIDAFKKTAEKYPEETKWWDQEKCHKEIPGLLVGENAGALYIEEGLTLDVKEYLLGLWQMGLRFGLQFQQKVFLEEDFGKFDKIVFATGTSTKNFKPLSHLPIGAIKGQMLRLKWPEHIAPLSHSLMAEGYVVMDKEKKSCMVGATFERDFVDALPHQDVAHPLIMEKIKPFFPSLEKAPILECHAGIRAISLREHLPIVGKVLDKYWFITGLGAKGLLYHGYLADALARAILRDDPSFLPSDMRI